MPALSARPKEMEKEREEKKMCRVALIGSGQRKGALVMVVLEHKKVVSLYSLEHRVQV